MKRQALGKHCQFMTEPSVTVLQCDPFQQLFGLAGHCCALQLCWLVDPNKAAVVKWTKHLVKMSNTRSAGHWWKAAIRCYLARYHILPNEIYKIFCHSKFWGHDCRPLRIVGPSGYRVCPFTTLMRQAWDKTLRKQWAWSTIRRGTFCTRRSHVSTMWQYWTHGGAA